MDIIFLFYGLAFFSLGLVILTLPLKDNKFGISSYIWLLGAFAILHGFLEWTELWSVVHGTNSILDAIKPFLLLVSFMFLFEFGRRIIRETVLSSRQLKLLAPGIYVVLLGGILIVASMSNNFNATLGILSRYLFGFVGSTLAGIGMLLYCPLHTPYKLSHYRGWSIQYASYIAAFAFVAYGIFGGLVVPRASWFPANWLNQESFLATVGVPLQIFRTVCAILLAVSISNILDFLHFEGNFSCNKH